ncbi:hypothetical protein ACOME3_008243 [Neoechinorhynchus agilis]
MTNENIDSNVDKVEFRGMRYTTERQFNRGACSRCGGRHTNSLECRARKARCYKCGKLVHLAKLCRTRINKISSDVRSDDEPPDHSIDNIQELRGQNMTEIETTVNGHRVMMFQSESGKRSGNLD